MLDFWYLVFDQMLVILLTVEHSPTFILHKLNNTHSRMRNMNLHPLRNNLFGWPHSPMKRESLNLTIPKLYAEWLEHVPHKQESKATSQKCEPVLKHFPLQYLLLLLQASSDV